MHTDSEIRHLARLDQRLESEDAKQAFLLLITEIYRKYGDIVRPSPHGKFSDLQIRPNERNCFAFKGAKNWLRWYFRKPAFEEDLADYSEVLRVFPCAEEIQDGEIAVNIYNIDDARDVLEYLSRFLRQSSSEPNNLQNSA